MEFLVKENNEIIENFATKVFNDYLHLIEKQIFYIIDQEEVTDFAKNILWETFLAINPYGHEEIYSELIENENFQVLRANLENLKRKEQNNFEFLETEEIFEAFNFKIVILDQKIPTSQRKGELIVVRFYQNLFFISKYQLLIPFIKDKLEELFSRILKEDESLWFAFSVFSKLEKQLLMNFPPIEYENLKEELIHFQIHYLSSLIPKYFSSKLQDFDNEKQISKLIFGEKSKRPKNFEKAKEELIKWLQKIETTESNMCITDIILSEVKPSEIIYDPNSSILQNYLIEQNILVESETKRQKLLKTMTYNIKANEKTYELLENLYPVSL